MTRWLLAIVMAISFIQADGLFVQSPGTTTFAAPAMAVASGNTIIVAIRVFVSQVTSVTDTAGNTYVQAGFTDDGNTHLYVYYADAILGHAANIVTGNFDSTVSGVHIIAAEYSGIATGTYTKLAEVIGFATPTTSAAFNITDPGTLVFVAMQSSSSGDTSGTWAPGSGYTERDEAGGAQSSMAIQDRIATSVETGSTASATFSQAGFRSLMVVGFSGGPSVPGTQPPAPAGILSIPLLFSQITIGGTVYNAAETHLADRTVYYNGYKPPILLKHSPITRELARNGYRNMRFSITVADENRTFRGLAATETIEGAYVRSFLVDDAVRRAEGQPFQIAAGFVVDYEAEDPFTFTFHVEDVLGRVFSEFRRERLIPSHLLTVSQFAGMDASFDGKAGPLALGTLVNAGAGVVPGIFMGEINLQDLDPGAVNVDVYVLLFNEGANDDNVDFYYNPSAWATGQVVFVGDNVRPTPANFSGFIYECTTAGTTGGTEPTWPTGVGSTVNDNGVVWTRSSVDDDTLRYVIPDSAFAATIGPCFAPHKPNWTTNTNLANQFVDYQGRRYGGLLFIDKTHHLADDVKEGRVTVTGDISGHAVAAAGTGGVIKSPGGVIQHLVKNCLLGESTWITYLADPTFDGVTDVIDAASFAAADAVSVVRLAGGYLVARLEGRRGEQIAAWTAIKEIQEGTDLDLGVSRLGQLMGSMENVAAAATVTFNALDDIISLRTKPNKDDYANRINHRYAYRYRDPVPPQTPTVGQPVSRIGGRPEGDWDSGQQILTDSAAITAVGREVAIVLDNYAVRDSATAGDVAAKYLDRVVGPPNSLDGVRTFELVTGLQGLGKNGVLVELGSVIAITHPEGMSATGWTDWRGRVLSMTVDPMNPPRVTLKGRVYDED